MNKELRQDLIYERVRDTREIRNELAYQLRVYRKLKKQLKNPSTSYRECIHELLYFVANEIKTLKWVLNHDN